MKKVLLIVNPVSGKVKSKTMLFDIINTMSENGAIVTTQITRKSGDATLFAKKACSENLYDIIVCSGGDGTLKETVSGIIESENKIPLGYIPGGTTNDYAQSLGLTLDVIEASKKSVTGKVQNIDIGTFNGNFFNYIASFGAFTQTSYTTPQSLKKHLGHLAYVLSGIKDIGKIKSTHVKFTYDDKVVEDDYIFGAIANTTSIGGMVHLDENLVGFNDGVFEVCLVKKPKNPADLVRIVTGAMSSNFKCDRFDFFKIKDLDIEIDGELDWSLDGEKYTTNGNIKINVIKDAIKMIL